MTLDDSLCLLGGKNLELIALDDALKGLAQLDAQQSRVVELRFFGGLSTEEAAEVGGLSVSADGRWLLFSQIDEISSDLMIVENLQ